VSEDSTSPCTAMTLPHPSMNPEWRISAGGRHNDELAAYGVLTALTLLAAVIVLATIQAQFSTPAPYGRHEAGHAEAEAGKWGPPVSQRVAHVLSDFPPGVFVFTAVFLGWGFSAPYGQLKQGHSGATVRWNWLLWALFVAHYVHRGLLHPLLIMRYSSRTVRIGIPLAGLFPNVLFCYINACWIATCVYPSNWGTHPAFIIGIILFSFGFVLNKYADWQTSRLRKPGETAYKPPSGLVLALNIANPNYLGELIEWIGYAIAAWSPPAIVWAAFGAATFVPRSKHNLQWIHKHFSGSQDSAKDAAAVKQPRLPRWALIPGVW
jgi:3-oxo-5-alpha-steroid 4-dehydrogenase